MSARDSSTGFPHPTRVGHRFNAACQASRSSTTAAQTRIRYVVLRALEIALCRNQKSIRNCSANNLTGPNRRVMLRLGSWSDHHSNALVPVLKYVRHFVAILLCSVAALGQAPAWLHVSLCNDCETHAHPSKPERKAHSCGHASCRHHAAQEETDSSEGTPTTPGHDSDSCAICQSLACPVGSRWTLTKPFVVGDVRERLSSPPPPVAVLFRVATVYPRGPPTSLHA